ILNFLNYRTDFLNILSCVASFLIANIGLEQIISWSTPMLMFLYPLAITLIILSIMSPIFERDPIVYVITTVFTIIPAFIDALSSAPAIIADQNLIQMILKWDKMYLPFAKL